MDLFSGLDGTLVYMTTLHQIQIHTQTLVTPTPHQVGTAIRAPLHKHSWREEVTITSNRMK